MENSYDEKRTSGRANARISVEILHEDFEDAFVESSNISQTGILVLNVDSAERLQVGQEFQVRITGLMGETTKIIPARVARIDGHDIALQFNEPLFS